MSDDEEQQSYCLVATNGGGHAEVVEACESQQEFLKKSKKYERKGLKVHGFPADRFEGFT